MARRERQERDLTVRSLQLRAGTIDEKARSVEAIIATEGRVHVFDWETWRGIDEVLIADGAELPSQVPLLESHRSYSLDDVLGSIRNLRVEGKQIIGTLFLAEGDEVAERAWSKVRQGHLTDVSVGYRVTGATDVKPNTKATIDGVEYDGGEAGLRVSTSWLVREVSLVPIGADQQAKIRTELAMKYGKRFGRRLRSAVNKSMASEGMTREQVHARMAAVVDGDTELVAGMLRGEFEGVTQADVQDVAKAAGMRAEQVIAEMGGKRADDDTADDEDDTTSDDERADGDTAVDTDDEDDEDDDEGERSDSAGETDKFTRGGDAEYRRQDEIRSLADGDSDIPKELVARALKRKWSSGRAARAFLKHKRREAMDPLGSAPNANRNAPGTIEQQRAAVQAAAMERMGMDYVNPNSSDAVRAAQTRAAEQGHSLRVRTALDLCEHSLRLAGRTDTPRDPSELFRAAVTHGDLGNVFSPVINKVLLMSFQEADDSTDGWVNPVDVKDFRTNTRVQLGKLGSLGKIARGGEAKHAEPKDGGETYKIARYGDKIVIDEQDIIDDDLNAMMQMPREMGAAAARLRPDLVYSILLANAALSDGTALFHADHGNLVSGGSSALDGASLQAGLAAMAKQRQDGVILNLRGRFIIVPQDLRFLALQLIHSAEVRNPAASGEHGTANPIQGEGLEIRSDARLGAAGVTDPDSGATYTGSLTNWFLSAAPNQGPTIEVAYRTGTGRRPQIRPFVLTQGQWGIGWDIAMDIGAKALAHQSMYRSAGA